MSNKSNHNNKYVKFNTILLVYGLIGGLLGVLLVELFMSFVAGTMPNALAVGISFAIFTSCMMGSCVLCEFISPRLTQSESKYNKYRVLAFIISIFAVGVLGLISQSLYGLGMSSKVEDFIFVIDDSGSMEWNDEFNERYDAVMELVYSLDEKDRIGMVKFSHEIVDTIPLQYNTLEYMEEFKQKIQGEAYGETDIELALREAIKISEQGSNDRYTMIILLTDGESDANLDYLTKVFMDRGIIINSIGLNAPENGRQLLSQLSEFTGGEYYEVFDAASLIPVMQGMERHIMRNSLIGPRALIKRESTFHKIFRVIFIMFLNTAIGISLQFIIDNRLLRRQLIVSAITGLIAGLILEIGFYNYYPAYLVRIAAFLIMTIIISNYEIPAPIVPSGYQTEIDIFATPEPEQNDEDLWNRF